MNGAIATGGKLPVPGPAARPEYLRLPRDLAALARGFGIVLPPQFEYDAAVLAFSIECADRFLDEIPEADRRARLSDEIQSGLRGQNTFSVELPPELAGWLAQLKAVTERHRVTGQFRELVRRLLDNSERLRRTRNHARFVACAVREGRWMVDLLLLILARVSTPAFESFMRQLSAPANLGDKLRDARRDFERGEIAMEPTLSFRARLAYEFARRTLRLTRIAVSNWRLARWGVQSLFSELIWFPFSRSHSR